VFGRIISTLLLRNTQLDDVTQECSVKVLVPLAPKYRGADKSLALPTSRYIYFFDDENISFDANLVI
jgi:hypothetical protein